MIAISKLSFSYTPDRSITFPDFALDRGEHCLLLGESGSGKTTLLHLLGGLLRDYTGSLQVAGTELNFLSEGALDKFRGQNIGFVFQKNHLINALSVRNNLLMAPLLAGIPQDNSRVETVLSQLSLLEKASVNVKELSHGQAQRVAIARAVINRPPLILADEPTSALDDKNCERVIDLLLEASQVNQATLVVATHDQRLKTKIQNHLQL